MSDYYWYEGQRIELNPSTTHRAVEVAERPTMEERRDMASAVGAPPQSAGVDLGNGIILFEEAVPGPRGEPPDGADRSTPPLPDGSSELRVFTAPDDTTMVLTREFIAQFKPTVTREQIDKYNASNGVRVERESEWERNSFVLALEPGSDVDAMDMANRYQESELTVYAQPNFVRLLSPQYVPNDPLFPRQWALRNTGQGGGIAGQDIHTVAAWDVTRGSTAITIAVIDEGVDYGHPDLNTPGKLVTGYDAVDHDNDPTPSGNDAHGTACAGVAAAGTGNGLGVSGVAPACRIMGVRIARGTAAGWFTSDAIIADAINTAVARGADVLSNSWGGGTPSTAITNAIRTAKSSGRGGRGCVVCFAAGNTNGPVIYPGTLPEVITVAACNEWGERKSPTSHDGETWWGSSYGSAVDVSAPGVHVTTTDIHGATGYSAVDYVETFNGTSAATPHVAGVAALVLSVRPTLRAAEVEAILRAATDDIGGQGYDVYTGYGRINALKAVQAAITRWDPPKMVPGWFGWENQGGDIAVADVSRNGRPDLLVFHVDNPGGENHGYYRIGWDLDGSGTARAWSAVKAVPGWFGSEDQGAGVALGDINRNGSTDLLVFHVDNPGGENHGYYRIGWNLNTAGDPTGGWSPVKAVPGWFGSEDQGAGVALADINGNGSMDLVVYHIDNPGGENHGYYRIGWNLNAAGDVTGGWSPVKPIPGWFGAENQGGGVAVADLDWDGRPELVVFHIDNPGGENRGYYRIGKRLNTTGDVTGGWSPVTGVPGWFGAENQGGGIAVADIDGFRKDLVVYHIDNPSGDNHGYYRIGWNLA